MKANWFKRNPKMTKAAAIGATLVAMLAVFELLLRSLMGLGRPILYDSSPVYGYRPLPNQIISRFSGSEIRVNNLGIRADEDWNANVEDKILFLGDSVTYGGSYISNDELFSTLAAKDVAGYKTGNAAVNAWGVANIHGLMVKSEFLPARVYVTVLLEDDFYRGLTRILGLPFWNRKPDFAIQELMYFAFHRLSLDRYRKWQEFASEDDVRTIAESAVIQLKEIDELLKSKGYLHLIFITPTRQQVLEGESKDEHVQLFLRKHELPVTYISEELDALSLGREQMEQLFYDDRHLSEEGHVIWGEIIDDELLELLEN